MKKFQYTLLALLVIASTLLSACAPAGEQPGEIILDPTTYEAQSLCDKTTNPNCVVTVDNRPTLAEKYNKCVAAEEGRSPEIISTEFFEQTQVWWCDGFSAGDVDQMDMILVPATVLTKFTPGPVDDLVVVGTMIGKNLVKYAIIFGTAMVLSYLAGEGLVWMSHSNPAHNPNISGSQARVNIDAFIALMAAYLLGGPDPKNKCGVTKDATGAIVRAAIWIVDATRDTGGYLVWFFVNAPGTPMKGPWGGSYDITSENFDMDRTNEHDRKIGLNWTPNWDCNSLNVPNFLQPAQR